MTTISGYDIEHGLVDARHGPEPDWTALYPICPQHPTGRPSHDQYDACFDTHDDCPDGCYVTTWETCGCSPLTPRMAFSLHTAAIGLADALDAEIGFLPRDGDIVDASDGLWAFVVPPAVQRVLTPEFAARYVAAFHTIAGRLAAGRGLSANCTGEEAAIHAMVEQLEADYADGEFEHLFDAELNALPVVGADDVAFAAARDDSLLDHDVLLLWDPTFDGIEDAEDDMLGLVNLHPTAWFVPFFDPEPAASSAA